MRDLGIDHQAARRRRIPVLRQRFQKAKQRKIKLRSLKIPALKIRLRLHKGGIQPVGVWGVEAQGLVPRYRTALRQAMAAHLGHHKGGLLDSAYDLRSNKHQDPADQVLIQRIKAVHTLYHKWPPEQMTHLEQAWSQQLQTKQHPWSMVHSQWPARGDHCLPHGMDWQVEQIHRWTRAATPLLHDNALEPSRPLVED